MIVAVLVLGVVADELPASELILSGSIAVTPSLSVPRFQASRLISAGPPKKSTSQISSSSNVQNLKSWSPMASSPFLSSLYQPFIPGCFAKIAFLAISISSCEVTTLRRPDKESLAHLGSSASKFCPWQYPV